MRNKFILITLLTLSLLSFGLASCGDETALREEFDIDDGDFPSSISPVRPGVYRATLNISDDTCIPSLSDVVAQRPGWETTVAPGSFEFALLYDVANSKTFPVFRMRVPTSRLEYRDRRMQFEIPLHRNLSPVSQQVYAMLSHQDRLSGLCSLTHAYPWPDDYLNFESQVTLNILKDNIFQLKINTQWDDNSGCLGGAAREKNPRIPVASCYESYIYTLKLFKAYKSNESRDINSDIHAGFVIKN